MRVLAAALTMLLALAGPSSADNFYKDAGGGWLVLGANDSCIAVNRSVAEFNASPYNALALHQAKGDNLPRFQAFFWPGAFEEGATVILYVIPAGGKIFELLTEAVSNFHLVSVDPAPEELLEAMTNVTQIEVQAEKIPEILVFETGTLETVADLMGECNDLL